MTRQMSLTHALTQLASTTIRSSSSVPPGRRGRAPASTRTKGSPARCRRIGARAGFDRSRVHSLTHSFAPNQIRIESAVSNAARTKLHWSRRYEGRDPIRRKKIRRKKIRWRLEEVENGNLRQRCVASTDRARTRRRRDASNERFDHRSCRVDLV